MMKSGPISFPITWLSGLTQWTAGILLRTFLAQQLSSPTVLASHGCFNKSHTPGGLQHNTRSFSYSSGDQKCEIGVTEPKTQCQQGHTPPGAIGERICFLTFSSILWLWALPSTFKASHASSCFSGYFAIFCVLNLPLLPSYRTICECTRAYPVWIK